MHKGILYFYDSMFKNENLTKTLILAALIFEVHVEGIIAAKTLLLHGKLQLRPNAHLI